MASVQKITLSVSRDIPFNKLVLSQSNVRRVKAGVSIEELADDIARRTLLETPRHLRRRRHDAGTADGVHGDQRPCPSGAGLGAIIPWLQHGTVLHPTPAHRRRSPRYRQTRNVRRRRSL